jgi:hypothetical protein
MRLTDSCRRAVGKERRRAGSRTMTRMHTATIPVLAAR